MSTLEEDLARIDAALTNLDVDVLAYLTEHTSPDSAVLLLWQVRQQLDRLKDLAAAVEADTVKRLGKKGRCGDVAYEVRGGKKRSAWRHDDVAWAVVKPLAADGNGALDDAALDLIGQVRDRILNAAQIAYWRAGMLRELGVDPDAYCTSEAGRRSVILTAAVDEQAAS